MERKFYAGKVAKGILIAAAVITLVGFVVMSLWNTILVPVIAVSAITFWQALGIFVLCKILFGFGGGPGPGKNMWFMRREMKRKMRNMNEEERAKFKEEMHRRMDFWYNRDNICRPPFGRSEKNAETDNNTETGASK